MEFEEAKQVLTKEWDERMAQWDVERNERISLGTADDFDKLCARWDKDHPKHWYDGLKRYWWKVERFFREQIWNHHWTYRLRDFWQRGRRGWSDSDWWNLNSHLAEVLPQMLRRMAEKSHGYPIDIYDAEGKSLFFEDTGDPIDPAHTQVLLGYDEDGDEPDPRVEAWGKTLEKIAIGFEAYSILTEWRWHHESEAEKELERMYEEGFMLFFHNFHGLWD